MMKKKSNQILLVILLLIALIFGLITIGAARSAYNKKVDREKITEPDFYSMQEASAENSSEVFKALKAGSADKLKKLMTESTGAEDLIGFADWKEADFDNAVSLGAGSLSTAPDKNGRIDISERFFVSVGEQQYVLYIETITSRHGMINDGVSVVAATTYEHFDELDYAWNGAKDDSSAVAGKSFITQ
jgi:hypothetical protein